MPTSSPRTTPPGTARHPQPADGPTLRTRGATAGTGLARPAGTAPGRGTTRPGDTGPGATGGANPRPGRGPSEPAGPDPASTGPGGTGGPTPRTPSGAAGTGPGRGPGRQGGRAGTGTAAGRPGRPGDRRRPADRIRRGPHHWFAERLLAVLSGRRPVHSLIGHTIGPAYDQLITLAPADPPHEPAYDPRRLSPVLHGCGRFTPGPGVIEAFARIATGDRLTALAFRLEQGPDLRWRCAAVELHGPRP